jgi:hypothetical protein
MTKLTREQAAVISAYTGFLAGPFSDMHEYAERILGYPVFTHQFASEELTETLQQKAKMDFLSLCADEGETNV